MTIILWALFAALFIIKVCGFAVISWWLVFMPLIVMYSISMFFILLVVTFLEDRNRW